MSHLTAAGSAGPAQVWRMRVRGRKNVEPVLAWTCADEHVHVRVRVHVHLMVACMDACLHTVYTCIIMQHACYNNAYMPRRLPTCELTPRVISHYYYYRYDCCYYCHSLYYCWHYYYDCHYCYYGTPLRPRWRHPPLRRRRCPRRPQRVSTGGGSLRCVFMRRRRRRRCF